MSNHDENDDYLWDKSGKPDPELAKLEASLSTLRHRPRAFVAPEAKARSRVTSVTRGRLALAASIALIGGAAIVLSRPPAIVGAGIQCEVTAIEGTSQAGASVVKAGGRAVSLTPGDDVVTAADSRARIQLGNGIGSVDVDPGTRVRLEELEDHAQRLSLAQGSISASVVAVPRLFIVDTPSARAIDLGCAYTLAVDPVSGDAHLAVTAGHVELADRGRRSVVPAGASCDTRTGLGPGTPYWTQASPAFRAALARVDFEMGGSAAMADVLRESTASDALTLVHLLPRASAADLPALYTRLAAIAPPPDGVTKAQILGRQAWAQQAWLDDVVHRGGVPDWKGMNPQDLLPKKSPR